MEPLAESGGTEPRTPDSVLLFPGYLLFVVPPSGGKGWKEPAEAGTSDSLGGWSMLWLFDNPLVNRAWTPKCLADRAQCRQLVHHAIQFFRVYRCG